MTTFEYWTISLAIASIVVNVCLFAGLGLQLRLLRLQNRQTDLATQQDHSQRRKEATLVYLTATLQDIFSLRAEGLPYNNPKDVIAFLESITDWSDYNDPKHVLVQRYLGVWEALAAGVNVGAYDLSVVDRVRGMEAIQTWSFYEPWIQFRRESMGWPTLFKEIEILAGVIAKSRGVADPRDPQVL